MTFIILFWVAAFLIFHTYVLFPLLVRFLARNKPLNNDVYKADNEFPAVSVLLAVYNEEKVIEAKLKSLDQLEYPNHLIEILIRSDASTDRTDEIISNFKTEKKINFEPLRKRQGKVKTINELAQAAKGDILVITDANVLTLPDTLRTIARHFKNNRIGLVDSAMINPKTDKKGISVQERAYISREVRIKSAEGRLWGTMMGPSGGFYAVRKKLFHQVPENFLVDDFYINMKVLASGKQSINDLESKAFEDVSNKFREEFKRKIRISAGNFQNLSAFLYLFKHPFRPLAFVFFSHKLLRWAGPLFLLAAYLSALFLMHREFYFWCFMLQSTLMVIPFLDSFLRKIKIHIVILRFVTHFYNMNLAILVGFIRYMKGIRSNVWEPTARNQS